MWQIPIQLERNNVPKVKLNLETKFYVFHQNNTGGRFIIDKENGIGEYVFVEATSLKDAVNKAEDIGIYFDGCGSGLDCSCCGDRWYPPYGDGAENIRLYGKLVEQYDPWSCETNIFVHRINGDLIHVLMEVDMESKQRPRPTIITAYINNKKTSIKKIDILN